MKEDRFESLRVGDEAEIFHTITSADIDTFAHLTGDTNPLHMDEAFAAKTSLSKRVVHGMLTASFISTIIGTRLPGEGALWYEQSLKFLTPVRIGERIRVWAKVKQKSRAQRILTIETNVYSDNNNRTVIEGVAKVKVLEPEEKKEISGLKKTKGAVIVTGASRGIGAAIAKELASSGHPVIINYLKDHASAENTVAQIRENSGLALPYQADVAEEASVNEMVQCARDEFGVLDGVVNNASSTLETLDFLQLSWENVQLHLDVQIKGAFHLCRAVVPFLLENKHGSIVNIASIYADNVPPLKLLPYSLAKSALISFSRSLAVELGPKGVRVNCVSPGMTQTDLLANTPEKAKMITKMQTPLRSLAAPEDTANAVAFLFSRKARHITGEILRVCGGAVMA